MPRKKQPKNESSLDLEIEIDENGDLLLTRDHQIMVELARLSSSGKELAEFESFFDKKAPNILGEKDYKSFCG